MEGSILNKVKKGDIVGRISYGKDIFFIVDRVIKLKKDTQVAILKGLTIRIKADSPTEDLELIDKKIIKNTINDLENRISERLSKYNKRTRKRFKFGKILHLDGDAHLSNKEKYSNTNTSEQVIFNHNKNNVSKIKIHYFFITKREEFCEREHI